MGDEKNKLVDKKNGRLEKPAKISFVFRRVIHLNTHPLITPRWCVLSVQLVPDPQNFLNFLKLGGLCRPIESTQINLFGKILKCSRDHKKIKSLAAGRRCETGTKEACELANTLKTTQHCSLKDLYTVLSITDLASPVWTSLMVLFRRT